jgi:hypothetical protein
MERRPFGRTGLTVPILGFGAGHVGDPALDEAEVGRIDVVHLHSCPLAVLERGEVVAALQTAVAAGKALRRLPGQRSLRDRRAPAAERRAGREGTAAGGDGGGDPRRVPRPWRRVGRADLTPAWRKRCANSLQELETWIRRRLRCYLWKQWGRRD